MKISAKLTALLVLLLSLTVLFSCNGDGAGATDVTTLPEQTESTTAPEGELVTPESFEIKLVDGRPNVRIVRSDLCDSDDVEVEAAMTVKNGITALFGESPVMDNDFLKPGESHDDSTFEILVGATNYTQSKTVASDCLYGEYVIRAVGNKIVIMAYSDHCMRMAATDFANTLSRLYDKETNTVKLDVSVINSRNVYDEQLCALPVYEGGERTLCSYYDAGNRTNDKSTQCDEIILKNTNEEEFSAYLAKLESEGFIRVHENTMNKCRFLTYAKGKHSVIAGYYGNDKSARLLIEPIFTVKNESPLFDRPHTKITDSSITLIGLEYPDSSHSCGYITNGICLLIRLEDGRFVIVDGGFNRALHGNNLVNAIKAQSKGYTSNPTVAAWIMTHAHGDHDGALIGYNDLFKNAGIKVETLLANFMSESERLKAVNASSSFSSNEGTRAVQTIKAAEALGADIYKVHVGQVYHFADLELEIMYTLESFAPSVPNGLNTVSIVTRMKFVGSEDKKTTTFLCTGDATGWAMETMHKMFGEYIQSDILQICHHGAGTAGNDNGVANAYMQVNASLILWPLGLHEYNVYVGKPYNKVVFEQSNYVECYFAGSQGDTVTVPIPYIAGQTEVKVSCIGDCPVSHDHNENTK